MTEPSDQLADYLDRLEAGYLTIDQTGSDRRQSDPEIRDLIALAEDLRQLRAIALTPAARDATRRRLLGHIRQDALEGLGTGTGRDRTGNAPGKLYRTGGAPGKLHRAGRLALAVIAAGLLLGGLTWAPEVRRHLIDSIATNTAAAHPPRDGASGDDSRTPGVPSSRGGHLTVAHASREIDNQAPAR